MLICKPEKINIIFGQSRMDVPPFPSYPRLFRRIRRGGAAYVHPPEVGSTPTANKRKHDSITTLARRSLGRERAVTARVFFMYLSCKVRKISFHTGVRALHLQGRGLYTQKATPFGALGVQR